MKASYTDPTVGRSEALPPAAGVTSWTVNSLLVRPNRFVTVSFVSMLPRSVPVEGPNTSKLCGARSMKPGAPPASSSSGGAATSWATGVKPSTSAPVAPTVKGSKVKLPRVNASAPVALTTSAPVSAAATATCRNAVVTSPPVAAKPARIKR